MNDNYLLKAWYTIKELVRDRNFSINKKYDQLSETDLNYLINTDELNLIGEKINGEKIIVKFINMVRVKVSYLQGLIDEIRDTYSKITILFVLKSKPSSIIKKLETKGLYNVQIFYSKCLQVNPTKHSLVPTHIKISEKESTEVIKKYHLLCKSQLPILLQTDVICRYYNFKKEDIIKIISRNKKTYNNEYTFSEKNLSEKELILEKNLLKNNFIKRRRSLINRRNELKKYYNEHYSQAILRYRYVK